MAPLASAVDITWPSGGRPPSHTDG
jgi:hypothetical protein